MLIVYEPKQRLLFNYIAELIPSFMGCLSSAKTYLIFLPISCAMLLLLRNPGEHSLVLSETYITARVLDPLRVVYS